MKRIITISVLLIGFCLHVGAQGRPHFSKEEFQAKQKNYLTKKAGLTPEEAEKFFVLYFDLQEKKRKMNNKVNKMIDAAKKQSSHETNYGSMVDRIINSRIEADKLERSYIAQYKKFLSDKKIYKLITAEMTFHLELLKEMKEQPRQRDQRNNRQRRNQQTRQGTEASPIQADPLEPFKR